MSDPISALADARFDGFVQVAEAGLCGMITLRGELKDTKLTKAVKKLTGVDVPDTGAIHLKGDFGAAWMSPDELLILTPYAQAQKASASLSKSLTGTHHLAAIVSDARATFTITGPAARDVLAKLSPADLSEQGFAAGQIRRTRLAQVPAAFWYSSAEQIQVVCSRSVAQFVFGLLKNAAAPNSTVDFF